MVPILLLAVLLAGCQSREPARAVPAGAGGPIVALVGGRVVPAPGTPAITDGVVLIEGGTIRAVGARRDVAVPPGARVLDCAGATVSAAFWNSHVHFMGPAWNNAASVPAEALAAALRAMLTSYGVAHVLDTGSSLTNTSALRRRIEAGEVSGPSILIAGAGLAPVKGSPYYIRPAQLPEPPGAAESATLAAAALDGGADGIKLFTGSWAAPRTIVPMDPEVVRGAVETAHRRGKFVIAHPSNSPGARIAIEGGVDILAHTFPGDMDGPWDRSLPAAMVKRGMALVPTLKIFPHELRREKLPARIVEQVLGVAQAQLRAFAEAGGQILFGTDVGYMADHDPTDEYVYMQGAGLSYEQILASLTTAPAQRFGRAARTGRLAPGLDADVAVVEGQPEQDVRALARVRYTLRGGRILFERAR
jgi:imidazolonepropionase-like amidohydrolase